MKIRAIARLLTGFVTAALPLVALSSLQTPIDFNFSFNGTNTVQVAWNAYPGKSYVLQTATNLFGTWSNSAPLIATSNSLAFRETLNKAKFSNFSLG